MSTPLSPTRLAYDDPATPAEMSADCRAAQAALGWPATTIQPLLDERDDLGREAPKRGEIEITAAAARLAGALNLQLDGD
jgi:hypothetical protein